MVKLDTAPSPVEVARAWRTRPGLVFLDSSMHGPGAISILAAEPDLVIAGGPGAWPRLEEELARRSRPGGADLGIPEGAAIGWLDFHGNFCFGFYESPYVFDHDAGRWLGGTPEIGPSQEPAPSPAIEFQPVWDVGCYTRAVQRAREYIAAGDIYQVCLAHPLIAQFEGCLFSYYERLRELSPAPPAAYLRLGGLQIASASPETFLRISGRGIFTRPIKGTRPRFGDDTQDERSAFDLLTSPKEVAELVMITDLERNDLGRVCEFGSVGVPELLRLESFQQVHHLVSTVRGTLREGGSHARALRECSPGGSISGAPKKRALEIIAEIEPAPRGLYTGAIGYFGFNGESQFAIAIRTAVAADGELRVWGGAGIVADSDPLREWEETLVKISALLRAAQPHAAMISR
ncbi:MAG: anthranilate synthase component I family protein [Terrimicrobiaceae bacterium]|nr:anthranilate synthase component I family protein [Terrimicrobiaceae bacterium]